MRAKLLIKRILFRLLLFLQLHRLLRLMAKRKVIILGYHGFVPNTGLTRHENHEGMHLEIARFEEQLRYLKSHYNIVPLEDVVRHYKEGTEVPDYPMVITVDDGYRSFDTQALPVLKEAGVPATVFLTTAFVDGQQMLWPDRVEYALLNARLRRIDLEIEGKAYSFDLNGDTKRARVIGILQHLLKSVPNESRLKVVEELERLTGLQLARDEGVGEHYLPLEWERICAARDSGLVSVGCHTATHPILTSCSYQDMREELSSSKARIESVLGTPCEYFCYPNGTTKDFNQQTRELLRELGFSCGVTAVQGVNGGHTDVLELKRFVIDNWLDWTGFVATVSGINYYLSRITSMPGNLLRKAGRSPQGGEIHD